MKIALLLSLVSFALGAVIPYFQNFENGVANWTTGVIVQSLPANDWALGNPNKKNGAFTGAHSGVNAWVTGLTFDYESDQYSALYSPIFDFSNITGNVALSFWAKWSFEANAGSFFDGVNVEYKVGTAAWDILGVDGEPGNWYNAGGVDGLGGPGWGDRSGENINAYILVFHLLPQVVNGKPSVQFRFILGTDSSQGDAGFAMDDFAIRPITTPSCPTIVSPANGASVNPVFVLNWNPSPSDLIVDYLVYAGASPTPSGYTPITGNSASGIFTGTFYWQVLPRTLLNLTATNCSVQSAVVVPPVSVPYSNNFESGPTNWTSVADSQSWVLGTPSKSVIRGAVSGVNAWVTGSLTGDYLESSVMVLYSPLIDFTAVTNQTASYVGFKLWRESEPDYDGVILQYTTDLGRNWATLGTTGEPTNWYTGPISVFGGVSGWSGSSGEYLSTSHLLPPTVNGRIVLFRFIFASDSNVQFNGFAMDDFTITTGVQSVPQCAVSASPSGAVLGSPVTLTWQQNSSDVSVSGYKLYISTTNNFTGIAPIEITGPSRYVTPVLRFGLYYWKVVPYNVIAGDAVGCRTYNFTAFEDIAAFPYSEDFEQGQGGWVSGGTASTWAFGTPNKTLTRSAASGVNCWINGGLTGTYATDEVSWVQSPLFDHYEVPTSFFSLKTIFKTEEKYDGAVVQIATEASSWTTLGVLGSGANWYTCPEVTSINRVNAGQNAWCNTSSTWMVSSYALPGVGLRLFKLRVLFASDSSNNYDGFGFDDVAITALAPTQPATSAVATSAVATSAPATSASANATSAGNVPTSAPTTPLTAPSASETETSGSVTHKALACFVALAVLVVM